VRSIRPDMRSVQMTGYNGRSLRTGDDGVRPDDVIQKPFDPDDLLRTIRDVLDHEPARDGRTAA
jgi:hypothetical protein